MEELGKEALYKLIEFIEGASPRLWEIAMRQVAADLARYWAFLVVAIVFGLLGIAAIYWAIKDEEDAAGMVGLFVLCLTTPAFFIAIPAIIGRMMNPEYYAIKVLMELLGIGG